jgi:hypothetical protein
MSTLNVNLSRTNDQILNSFITKNMKSIIIALFAVITFVAAQGKDHCIDKAFTAQIILINPHNRLEDINTVYYDTDANKQRLDIFEFEPEIRSTHVWLRHDLQKEFIFNNQTKECIIRPISGKLEQFCLAKNATKASSYVIGDPNSGLKVDLWEETLHGWNLRIGIAAQTAVPVNLFSRGGSHHSERHIFEEWINFVHGVKDQSVFDLPKECTVDNAVKLPVSQMSANFRRAIQKTSAVFARNY